MRINPYLVEDIEERLKINKYHDIKSLDNAFISYATAPSIIPATSSGHFYENFTLLNNNKFQKFIMEGKYTNNFK